MANFTEGDWQIGFPDGSGKKRLPGEPWEPWPGIAIVAIETDGSYTRVAETAWLHMSPSEEEVANAYLLAASKRMYNTLKRIEDRIYFLLDKDLKEALRGALKDAERGIE